MARQAILTCKNIAETFNPYAQGAPALQTDDNRQTADGIAMTTVTFSYKTAQT